MKYNYDSKILKFEYLENEKSFGSHKNIFPSSKSTIT